jgi:hypothetical protein
MSMINPVQSGVRPSGLPTNVTSSGGGIAQNAGIRDRFAQVDTLPSISSRSPSLIDQFRSQSTATPAGVANITNPFPNTTQTRSVATPNGPAALTTVTNIGNTRVTTQNVVPAGQIAAPGSSANPNAGYVGGSVAVRQNIPLGPNENVAVTASGTDRAGGSLGTSVAYQRGAGTLTVGVGNIAGSSNGGQPVISGQATLQSNPNAVSVSLGGRTGTAGNSAVLTVGNIPFNDVRIQTVLTVGPTSSAAVVGRLEF